MRPLPIGDTRIGVAPDMIVESHTGRMIAGPVGSAVVHLLAVLLLVFGLPWRTEAAPAVQVIPVDLVWLGPETAPPASATTALPQTRAPETATATPETPVPAPRTPPPEPARHPARGNATSSPTTAMPMARIAPVPIPPKKPTPSEAPRAERKRQTTPDETLSVRLQQLARLRQPDSPKQPDPAPQTGSGLSNLDATSARAAPARDATYRVKDFIRAQVQRRWYMDRAAIKRRDWVVAIHIHIEPNGRVSAADIVDDARVPLDSAYRGFALSARNAVLLSSPLAIPPGTYDIAKDIVIDFEAKQVLQ
jgi:outer membrane biosynthesis protein TonB